MGNVQEAELEIPSSGGFIVGEVLRAARSRRRRRAGFGFAIRDCAYDLYTQRRIMAAATVSVIRRRAANQFRKSGVLLVSQPGIAQKR
jgi:hypothetical protein